MRLDFFLVACRLVKRRSLAKALVEGGGVFVEGERGKAGRQVRVGEEILLRSGRRQLCVRVLALPGKKVSKESARKLYEVVSEEEDLGVEPPNAGDRGEVIDFLEGR